MNDKRIIIKKIIPVVILSLYIYSSLYLMEACCRSQKFERSTKLQANRPCLLLINVKSEGTPGVF